MTIFAHGGISIKLFVVNLHIINECLSYKFHPYTILTGHTKVESVAYQVLKFMKLNKNSKRIRPHCDTIIRSFRSASVAFLLCSRVSKKHFQWSTMYQHYMTLWTLSIHSFRNRKWAAAITIITPPCTAVEVILYKSYAELSSFISAILNIHI